MSKNTVTVFKNIKATSTGFHRDLDFILGRIKNGNCKEKISLIRLTDNKEERNKLKMELPSVCFSGVFTRRSVSGLKTHSGLICLDFDGFPDEEELSTWRDSLADDDYTLALFTSPSGNGLKLIVRIPAEPENHKSYFDALKAHYDCKYFDEATSDVSRVCYESWDPELVYNEGALTWLDKGEEKDETIGATETHIPIQSDNRIISKLDIWWQKKFGSTKGSRNVNMFKLAIALNDFGISRFEAENHCKQYAQEGFTEGEIETIIKSAYRNSDKHGTKFFEDVEAKQKIEKMIRSGSASKDIKADFPEFTPDQIDHAIEHVHETMPIMEYWTYTAKGKIMVVPHKYKYFLEQNQYFKFFPEASGSFLFVNIEANLLSEVSAPMIKDFVLKDLLTRDGIGYGPYDHVADKVTLFSDRYLSLLDTAEISLKKDTEDTCHLYFNDCAIEVTKERVKKLDYLDLEGFVWKKHVVDRPYREGNGDKAIFKRFIELIAGEEEDRIRSLRSVFGYLLHSYKTSANNKAIIFNDQKISENPNGGSGKGLFCNAVSQLKRVGVLDGKQFSFDKSFPYQTIGADCQVLLFDDIKKNFPFEGLFSLITEGITLERKNKDAIYIPVQRSPKIVINTNYTVGGIGGSFDRRKFEVELSSHFNSNHTPFDEFGSMLFEDWDEAEWGRFNSFAIGCIQFYLENGLVAHEFHNLDQRKFIKETSPEFVEWATKDNLPMGKMLNKKEVYQQFIDEYSDMQKFLNQRTFTKWVEIYAKKNGCSFDVGRTPFRYMRLNHPDDYDTDF